MREEALHPDPAACAKIRSGSFGIEPSRSASKCQVHRTSVQKSEFWRVFRDLANSSANRYPEQAVSELEMRWFWVLRQDWDRCAAIFASSYRWLHVLVDHNCAPLASNGNQHGQDTRLIGKAAGFREMSS